MWAIGTYGGEMVVRAPRDTLNPREEAIISQRLDGMMKIQGIGCRISIVIAILGEAGPVIGNCGMDCGDRCAAGVAARVNAWRELTMSPGLIFGSHVALRGEHRYWRLLYKYWTLFGAHQSFFGRQKMNLNHYLKASFARSVMSHQDGFKEIQG
jgi:hypothetical protein